MSLRPFSMFFSAKEELASHAADQRAFDLTARTINAASLESWENEGGSGFPRHLACADHSSLN